MIIKPEWNENRQLILKDRYAYKNEKSYNDIINRICNNIDIPDLDFALKDFKFVPAGRILSGLGTEATSTFFNCYVLSFKNINNKGIDSRLAISNLMERVFEISARGGGIGINWSPLRPSSEMVYSVNGKSSGTVGFLRILDSLVKNVSQGGSRRGAMMAGLEPWHPDIFRFITSKEDLNEINTANLSVFVSDKFMEAVKNNEDWDLMFPDVTFSKYDELWDGNIWKWLEQGYPVKIYDTVKAVDIYNLITKYAHQNGEPGMVFLERYNKWNITNSKERIICTNPCGEIGLPANGVCNLGSINLTQFIDVETGKINYDDMDIVINIAVEFLDRIIDINPYYQKETKEHQEQFRKIGLGIMGLADFLILRRIKYGSEKSLKEVSNIMSFIQRCAFLASNYLAGERGAAPIWDISMIDNKYIKSLPIAYQKTIKKDGLRNTRLLTVAPTGTISSLAGVSSGIEPNFTYKNLIRRDRLGERKEKEHWLYALRQKYNFKKDLFISASDLTVEQHIKMQAMVQKYIDSSISKTINAKADANRENTKKAFMQAYDLGCKGITYYRDGSRQGVLIKEENKKEISNLEERFIEAGDNIIKDDVEIPKEPPVKLYKRRDNHSKKWYFFIAFADRQYKRPFALFIKTNNYAKGDVADWVISKMERLIFSEGVNEKLIEEQTKKYSGQSNVDKIARSIGMALRHNISIINIVQTLDKCKPEFSSLLFHIKKLLEMFIEDGTKLGRKCDECGGEMIMQEGCAICSECGISKCG